MIMDSTSETLDLSEEEIPPCLKPPRTAKEIHANAIRILRYYRGRFYFDRKKANHIVKFIETQIVHIEGELGGQLVILQRWQKRLLRRAFGWFCHADPSRDIKQGQRKYRIVWVFIPRKNGKSLKGSAVGIYLLAFDGEKGAKVVSAAADTDQAGQIFDVAKRMILSNPKLEERIKSYRSTLVHYKSGSNYKILSSTADNKHGKNLSGVVFDELHAQPDRDLYDVLHTAIGARLNPMEWVFTTAGYDKKTVCYEQYLYALRVQEFYQHGCDPAYGVPDDHFLPCLFYADENDDWHDEETWRKANPNLGISVKMHYIRSEYQKAVAIPAYENTFKRLHLNQWTEQETRWVAVEEWEKCAKPINEEELKGRDCFVGFDGASKVDLAALSAIFPFRCEDPSDPKYGKVERVVIKRWLFCPKDTIARRSKEDRVQYDVWERQGLLIATPGSVVDHTVIRSTVHEIASVYQILEIGADPWNAHQLLQDLQSDGFKVIEVPQTMLHVSDATKELEALVISRRLEHEGCPIMRWMFKNIAVDTDGNKNVKLNKSKSSEKIDGIVALVNALSRYLRTEKEGPSVYETRGLSTT
jgi:phage terminase large subunit-like protein